MTAKTDLALAAAGSRRRFLTGVATLLFAPAIVRAGSVMPVSPIGGPVAAWIAEDAAYIDRMVRLNIPVLLQPLKGVPLFRAAGLGFFGVATYRGHEHWWESGGWRTGLPSPRAIRVIAEAAGAA